MKIATHNVEFLFDEGERKHSGKSWNYTKEYVEKRVEHLAKLYSEIDADVLFLQEVASEDVIKRIIEKSGKKYFHFLAQADKSGVGNAVLYKSKEGVCESIEAITDYPVFVEGDKDTIGPRLYSRRAFVGLTTTYNNKPLHLFGLHLNARFFIDIKNKKGLPIKPTTQIEGGDALIRSESFRFVQARKIRQVIDSVFATDKEAQIVVVGDFNSRERETPYRMIQGEFNALDDSLTIPHIAAEKRFSYINEQEGKKLIDHVLISKKLVISVKSFDILNEDLKQHNNKHPIPTFVESDHAPLVLELS